MNSQVEHDPESDVIAQIAIKTEQTDPKVFEVESGEQLHLQQEALNRDLHPLAEAEIKKCTYDFATSLLLQSKTLAHRKQAEMVLRPHVTEALRDIKRSEGQRTWKEYANIIGGTLLGTFLQGFIAELSSGPDPLLTSIYVAMGFVGMLLIFIGLSR